MPSNYGRLENDMDNGSMTPRQTNRLCMWIMLALAVAGAWVAAGFAIANYGFLNESSTALVAQASASDDLPTAYAVGAQALLDDVSSEACQNISSCPTGDLDCNLCKCKDTVSEDSCVSFDCACDSILDDSGDCVLDADLSKCAICKFGAGKCAK